MAESDADVDVDVDSLEVEKNESKFKDIVLYPINMYIKNGTSRHNEISRTFPPGLEFAFEFAFEFDFEFDFEFELDWDPSGLFEEGGPVTNGECFLSF